MSLIRAPQQRFQPQGNGALNDAHPLRRYVKFAFLGSAGKHRDLTQRHSLAQGASAALGSSTAGIGLVSAANNTWVNKKLSTAELNDFTGDITLIWHGVVLGVNAGANNRLISVLYGDGASSPFSIVDLYRPPSDNTQISFATNNGSFQSVTFTPNFSAHNGSPITLVVSNRAGEATVLFVSRPIGFSAVVTSANLGAAAGSPRSSIANSELTIGGQQVNGSYPNAITSAALILNRAVSQQEAVWISQNVWSFFSGPSRDIATSLMHAAGGANVQAGSPTAAAGTATVSATAASRAAATATAAAGSATVSAVGATAPAAGTANAVPAAGTATVSAAGAARFASTAAPHLWGIHCFRRRGRALCVVCQRHRRDLYCRRCGKYRYQCPSRVCCPRRRHIYRIGNRRRGWDSLLECDPCRRRGYRCGWGRLHSDHGWDSQVGTQAALCRPCAASAPRLCCGH